MGRRDDKLSIKSDLHRLDQMRDEDIDYSDAPEPQDLDQWWKHTVEFLPPVPEQRVASPEETRMALEKVLKDQAIVLKLLEKE